MASQDETLTSENTHKGIADIWDVDARSHTPPLAQSTTKSSIATSISFLSLPREIRDMIYRYLLSTEYTKRFSKYPRYDYCFHPSILRASRQIEREASHILYNENSLVRVRMCALNFWVSPLDPKEDQLACIRNRISVLAAFGKAHKFTRHTMEFTMQQQDTLFSDRSDSITYTIVIAGEDLPEFCQILLEVHASREGWLDQQTLAVEFFSERTDAIAVRNKQNDAVFGGEGFLRGNRSIETTTSIKDHGLNHGGMPIACKEPIGNGPLTLHQAINPGEHASSIALSPRLLKLLKALHRLHSLHGARVEGPIGDDHKAALLLSMLGPPPSDLEMFAIVLSKFEDAMTTYNAGDQKAGLIKLELTDDTITQQMMTVSDDWAGDTIIPTGGPYAGHTVRKAQQEIQIQVWTKMAREYLEIGGHQVCEARVLSYLIINGPSDPFYYWDSSPQGNNAAMAFYLGAQACDAQGKLGYKPRVGCLRDALDCIRMGLQHKPDDLTLRKEMEEKKDELFKDLKTIAGEEI